MKARYWYDLWPGTAPVFDFLTEPTIRTWKPYRGWVSQAHKTTYGVILISSVAHKDFEKWVRTRIEKLNRPRGVLLIYIREVNRFNIHVGLAHQTRKMEAHEWGMENEEFSIRKGKAIPMPKVPGFSFTASR